MKISDIQFSPHRLVTKEFVKKIKKLSAVRRIVLFGSVAKRTEKLTSDIDILVVTDKRNKDLENAITSVADEILKKSRMKIIPFVMTDREAREDKQFADELRKGEILYERVKGG